MPMLLPALPWGCTGKGFRHGEHSQCPQFFLPQGQELAGGCAVAMGSSALAHPCSQPWEHSQMCSAGGVGVQQAALPTP